MRDVVNRKIETDTMSNRCKKIVEEKLSEIAGLFEGTKRHSYYPTEECKRTYEEAAKDKLENGESQLSAAQLDSCGKEMITAAQILEYFTPIERFYILVENIHSDSFIIESLMYEVLSDANRFANDNLYVWLIGANFQLDEKDRFSKEKIVEVHGIIVGRLRERHEDISTLPIDLSLELAGISKQTEGKSDCSMDCRVGQLN